MSIIIDHIGAVIIGGLLLLALTAGLLGQREQTAKTSLENIAQQHLQDLYETVNYDFSKIGYGTTLIETFKTTKPDSIAFLADLDDNGTVDTVRYYCGRTADMANTPNPDDFEVFRKINGGQPQAVGVGVTRFNLTYVDARGVVTSSRELIRGVDVEILVQSAAPIGEDREYAGAYADITFYPMNLVIQ